MTTMTVIGGWQSVLNFAWEISLLLHLSVLILLTLRILSVQRNTNVAIAWLAILFALPVLGVVAYLLIGEPMIGRRYRERREQANALLNEAAQREQLIFHLGHELLPENYVGVSHLGTRWTGFGVYNTQSMQLLTQTDEFFEQLLVDIDAAKHSVLLAFYIIYPLGRVVAVIDALIDAQQRGVECHVLADSVGSFSFFGSQHAKRLSEAGVMIHRALPVGLFKTLFKRTDLRNHRKIIVIDEHIGYTGSFNLVDPSLFKQHKNVGQWIDVMMRIVSDQPISIVTALANVVAMDIGAESKNNLAALGERVNAYTLKLYAMKPSINDINDTPASLKSAAAGALATADDPSRQMFCQPRFSEVAEVLAQLIPSAPQMTAHVIYNTLVSVIHRANKQVIITTPYFVPDEALLGALLTAAKRGVAVTLIVPKKVDSFLVQHASQAHYLALLEVGVTIARFVDGLLHTKMVVIDEDYCLFGTVNIDMRSFYLNMEVSLAIYSSELVHQLIACQYAYMCQCEILSLEEWRQRPNYQYLLDNGVRLMSPLL